MTRTLWAILTVALLLPVAAPRANAQDQTPPPAAPATATAAPGAPPATPQGRKKRVAIFDFDYATVQTASAAAFGTNVDVGKGITDLLVKYLVQDGTYSVIERQALDKILAEQNFSNSDRANPTSAAKIGKLLGVDAIIVGAITQFGNDTKNTNVGGGGGGLGGFGIGGISPQQYQGDREYRRAHREHRYRRNSGRRRRPRRVLAVEHGLAGRRRQLARLGRRQRRLRQQRLSADDHRRGRQELRRAIEHRPDRGHSEVQVRTIVVSGSSLRWMAGRSC